MAISIWGLMKVVVLENWFNKTKHLGHQAVNALRYVAS